MIEKPRKPKKPKKLGSYTQPKRGNTIYIFVSVSRTGKAVYSVLVNKNGVENIYGGSQKPSNELLISKEANELADTKIAELGLNHYQKFSNVKSLWGEKVKKMPEGWRESQICKIHCEALMRA